MTKFLVRSEGVDLDTQFARLAALEAGWYDGKGEALTVEALRTARWFLDLATEQGIPRPHLYPTEEGAVRAEWSTAMPRREVSIEWTAARVYLHSVDIQGDGCEELDVEATAVMQVAIALRRLLISISEETGA